VTGSAKPKSQGPARSVSRRELTHAANAGDQFAAGVDKPEQPLTGGLSAADQSKALQACGKRVAPTSSCKVVLKIAIFFDGTGNNLDADLGTFEHSNVARLYRAHPRDDDIKHQYRRYVPGLGTYFKDVGDQGDDNGMAFARYGDARLEWAMKEVDSIINQYVPDRIISVHFALFGFSRGAALARAFAIMLQKRCKAAGAAWHWTSLNRPADIYFMGIWDTVASVGLPASSGQLSFRIAKKWVSLDDALQKRRTAPDDGITPPDKGDEPQPGIALGHRPGAMPAPGLAAGHMGWGDDLRLPPMTLKCVHFTAGHEVRNSFPLDSVREGIRWPVGIAVDERVYPGVHSDVGGGYRPGEGGKSPQRSMLMSLVPLNEMLAEARKAGVPLTQPIEDDFAMHPEMLKRWHAYMTHPSLTSNRSTEAWMLAHMRLYYAWRFHVIRRNQTAKGRAEAADINAREKTFREEEASLDRQIAEAEKDPERLAAMKERDAANAELEAANMRNRSTGGGNPYWQSREKQAAESRVAQARARKAAADRNFAEADDKRARLVARKRTLPGSGLVESMDTYDANLMLDAQAILEQRRRLPNVPLRPHYVRLIEAYEAEFKQNRGLLKEYPDALALFDHHVHDSLAGFAKDATLPSDPRIVFLGRDERAMHANLEAKRPASMQA
jgi:hypothetical protein